MTNISNDDADMVDLSNDNTDHPNDDLSGPKGNSSLDTEMSENTNG